MLLLKILRHLHTRCANWKKWMTIKRCWKADYHFCKFMKRGINIKLCLMNIGIIFISRWEKSCRNSARKKMLIWWIFITNYWNLKKKQRFNARFMSWISNLPSNSSRKAILMILLKQNRVAKRSKRALLRWSKVSIKLKGNGSNKFAPMRKVSARVSNTTWRIRYRPSRRMIARQAKNSVGSRKKRICR